MIEEIIESRDKEQNARLCIHPYYRRRMNPIHFDDRNQRDEWQDAVYSAARAFAYSMSYKGIVDYGCGSGFKLMKYFSGFDTVGYEIEPALSYVKEVYQHREWRSAEIGHRLVGDLLICSDVIEHIKDPVSFMERLVDSSIRHFVLSTPALEILAERGESPRLGPPDNKSHVNEWTTREFRDFVEMFLVVERHAVIDARQGTQMIVARPR